MIEIQQIPRKRYLNKNWLDTLNKDYDQISFLINRVSNDILDVHYLLFTRDAPILVFIIIRKLCLKGNHTKNLWVKYSIMSQYSRQNIISWTRYKMQYCKAILSSEESCSECSDLEWSPGRKFAQTSADEFYNARSSLRSFKNLFCRVVFYFRYSRS